MRTQKIKPIKLITLMAIAVSVFFCAGIATAYAAESPLVMEMLSVDEVWLTGDVLHIAVTDRNNGENQTLELNLSDYAKPGDEYVSVQATDNIGRTSNVVQFKNPYYVQSEDVYSETLIDKDAIESSIPDSRPFTPDGTGSVVDNATDGDGKEFFTVETADGSIYYLIVDRQRNAENVYFLNAVTEDDLMPLAKPGDEKIPESAIPEPSAPVVTPTPEPSPEPTPAPPVEKSESNTGTIALVAVAAIVVGDVGYYFKIVRPKKDLADDDSYDEPDGDEELPLDDESEGDDE
jgi:hypothetical protein